MIILLIHQYGDLLFSQKQMNKLLTTGELLTLINSQWDNYPKFDNHPNGSIYAYNGKSGESTDYSIEVIAGEWYEVRHTGNTVTFDNVDDVLTYIQP